MVRPKWSRGCAEGAGQSEARPTPVSSAVRGCRDGCRQTGTHRGMDGYPRVMASDLTANSNSSVQTEAERVIVARLAEAEGLTLLSKPGKIAVGSASVNVDAATADETVLVEAYARQGRLKGSQPKKIAQDILKLALIKMQPGRESTRAIVAFASQEACDSVTGWLKQAANSFDVEFRVVDIGADLRARIEAAQRLQVMVNQGDLTE